MNTVEAFLTSFSPKNPSFSLTRKLPNRKKFKVYLCNSNGSAGGSSSSSPQPEGDQRNQEMLAKMAMLQAQKVRLTDFLDERSAYLTQFAEDANVEFDEIAENALKELDEASARIMEKLDQRMQEFEERSKSNKDEIERSQKTVADFEDQIQKDRNEGLFFKNLGQITPKEKGNANEEIQKIKQITRENEGSIIRRNFYLAFICLLSFAIVDALISSTVMNWPRIGVLGVILLALITQLVYELKIMSSGSRKVQESTGHPRYWKENRCACLGTY